MPEMKAKYNGRCRKCGLTINIGDVINWTLNDGASHIKCPEKESDLIKQPSVMPKPSFEHKPDPIPVMETIYTIPIELKPTLVNAWYYEGEYLSGYMCDHADIMEKLGLCHYVEGWGTHLNDQFTQSFGIKYGENFTFTLEQAENYAHPILEKSAKAKFDLEIKKYTKKNTIFELAKSTNQPQIIKQWSEDCDGSEEECNIDNLTEYVMPDGTTKIIRSHTW